MKEEQRQEWIAIVMELSARYYEAQLVVAGEYNGATDPETVLLEFSERIAQVIGDGATAAFVYETMMQRVQERRRYA